MNARLSGNGWTRDSEGPRTIRSLAACMLGESATNKKAACLIANMIEDDLIRRHWPHGAIYGGEAELIKCFGVGRTIVREAVRILDVRGSARMRPGPHGGLRVLVPEREPCAATVASYIHLQATDASAVHEALAILDRTRARLLSREDKGYGTVKPDLQQIFSIAFSLFGGILADLSDIQSRGARPHLAKGYHSRAEQIARSVLSNHRREDWLSGIRIGSASQLCERYHADRSIVRQAIRVLESGELAVAECGRGRGLRSQMPGPATVCRLVSCYFAAHGFAPADAMVLFRALAEEATASVVRCAEPAHIDSFARSLDTLRAADSATAADALRTVESCQFAALNNPLIDFFLLCTRVYSTYFLGDVSHCRAADAVYLGAARELLMAIEGRDEDRALAAERRKQSALALALSLPWNIQAS